MTGDIIAKETKTKSFSLKKANARKVETMAFEKEKAQSAVVDEMIEEFQDGS